MQLVIGSKALTYHRPDLVMADTRDTDVIVSPSIDITLAPYNEWDCHHVPLDIMEMMSHKEGYVFPSDLLTIKMSHMQWDINWEKTLDHVLLLLDAGCEVNIPLYNKLVEWWKVVHGDKIRLSLMKSSKDFFDDAVVCEWEHDYLHECVSYPFPPIYTTVLKDGEEVFVDKQKFDKLSYFDRINMFREEIAVIAFERWLLNKDSNITWHQAHFLALKRTITNLTKNWASDFIIHNIRDFVSPVWGHYYNIFMNNEFQLPYIKKGVDNEVVLRYINNVVKDGDCTNATIVDHTVRYGAGEWIIYIDGTLYKTVYTKYAGYAGDVCIMSHDIHVVKKQIKTIVVYE